MSIRPQVIFHSLFCAAGGIWLGSIVATGAFAAILFPTLKALDPELPQYASFDGDHWSLAAGQIAERLFFVSDIVQLLMFIAMGVSLLIAHTALKSPIRTSASVARLLGYLALGGILTYELFRLRPRMNVNLRLYWDAAVAGQSDIAATYKAAFDADHPTASFLLSATAVFLLVVLIASLTGDVSRRRGDSHSPVAAPSGLETPKLARGGTR